MAGGLRRTNCTTAIAVSKGTAGTSYSGGTGGGAIVCNNNSKSITSSTYYGKGSGGAGGAAFSQSYNTTASSNYVVAGGGAGNPGGYGHKNGSQSTSSTYRGGMGTGGLLIIYGKEVVNDINGTITAAGAHGGNTSGDSNAKSAGGGGSGGGSINIYSIETFINNGTEPSAVGGAAGTRYSSGALGGKGGNGCVTYTDNEHDNFN